MTPERRRLALLTCGVGALVLSTLLWITIRQGLFDPKIHFVLTVDRADSITPGVGIEYAGFEIGKVAAVDLNPDGIVEVSAWVERKHRKFVRSDSGFFLDQPIVGPARVRIETANLAQPPLPDGARRPLAAFRQTDQLMTSGLAMVAEVRELFKSISNPEGSFQKILVNIQGLTATLHTKGLLAGAINDPAALASVQAALVRSQSLINRVHDAASSVVVLANSSDKLVRNADTQLLGKEGVVQQAQHTLLSLHDDLIELKKTLNNTTRATGNIADASAELTELRLKIDGITRQVDSVLDEVQRILPNGTSSEIKLP